MGLLQTFSALFVDQEAEEEAVAERQVFLDHSKVLVIDDDKNFADATAASLVEAGFTVLKSNNGTKGLNMIRYAGSDVKVVLLDYDMPQLDGLATLKFIRQFSPQMKVIAATGVDPKFLPAAFREGVDLLIFKPFQAADLINHVHGYIYPAATATKEKPTP